MFTKRVALLGFAQMVGVPGHISVGEKGRRIGRKVAVLLAICFAANVILAETPTPRAASPATTASRPWNFFTHSKARRAKIADECRRLDPTITGTVVLLGDSITEAHPAKQISSRRVINMGIAGDQIAMDQPDGGVRSRLDFLAQARPAHVFLLIGINDLGASKPLALIERQYADLVEAIRVTVPGAQLHLQAVLPTRGRFAHLNSLVKQLNVFICGLAARHKCDFVDLWSVMADDAGELRGEYTRDGLHLVGPAYEKWIAILEERVGAARWWSQVATPGVPAPQFSPETAVISPPAPRPASIPQLRGTGRFVARTRASGTQVNRPTSAKPRRSQSSVSRPVRNRQPRR